MKTVSLAEARASFSQLVDDAVNTHQRVEVTRNGRRAVIIMSVDDFDSIIETLEILNDPQAMADIREPTVSTVSSDDVLSDLRARGIV